MSESKEQFKTVPTTEIASASSVATQPPPPSPPTPVQSTSNLQRIDTLRITGPLVVFFGPREIGKTVTLLRLCTYLRSRYQISPDENFRVDSDYAETVSKFDALLQSM